MDHLLFAAEQYAAAQATAAAAAQYYASAAMNAAAGGAPNGAVLLPPGTLVVSQPVSQPQLMSLPASHTWSDSGAGGGGLPPAPPPPQYSQHDHRAEWREERRHRERRERSRSRERHRGRSSRERSRSRDRSSRGRRERSRSWSRGRDQDRDFKERRERDHSPRRGRAASPGSEEDWRMATSCDTIMIRGLPLHITEQHVQDNIMCHRLKAQDIRLIRKKDTGASRGFAFVEFSSVEEAKNWMEAQQGWLSFDGVRVSMQYSAPRDQRFEQPKQLNDWTCAKCGVQNFRRREACFKCNGPKSEYDSANIDQADEVSTHPTNTVLLSGLDTLTTEDAVLNTLGPLTSLPLKNVKIGRDPVTSMSRGVCYVEMNSVVDAMFLHNQLIANPPSIDAKTVEVSYYKQLGAGAAVTSSSGNQAAANSAMAAAQWSNKGDKAGAGSWSEEQLRIMAEYSADMYAKTPEERAHYVEYYKGLYRDGGDTSAAEVALTQTGSDKKAEKKNDKDLGKVVVSGVEYKRYPPPDTSTYQYDETSGYYYDPVSTLYYDANSQYYYNSKTSKFHYWDATHDTFLPVPDGGKEKVDDKKSPNDKVKSAKKIAKEMAKWEKKMNQRKDQSRTASEVRSEAGNSGGGKGAEDIAFNLLQRKTEDTEGSGLAGLAGYASDEEEEATAGNTNNSNMAIAELKLIDWNNLTCLLCQRAFKSREQLQKHINMSELHQTNLSNWRAQYTERGGGEGGNTAGGAGGQYRDRAKERRTKFGDDDKPIKNKFKEKYLSALESSSAGGSDMKSAPKVSDSNIGNKMLQKMGWKDGQGLGKKGQGRTEIIIAETRTMGSGLGTEQSKGGPGDSYKESARKTLWSRYNAS